MRCGYPKPGQRSCLCPRRISCSRDIRPHEISMHALMDAYVDRVLSILGVPGVQYLGRCSLMYTDLRSYLKALERSGQLIRIRKEVDPDQEITVIQHRVLAAGGPALLFERVKGSVHRVAANLFGTRRRVAMACGEDPSAFRAADCPHRGKNTAALLARFVAFAQGFKTTDPGADAHGQSRTGVGQGAGTGRSEPTAGAYLLAS